MQYGNLVTFNKVPGPNTPGVPHSGKIGVATVISENAISPRGLMFNPDLWVEVMWPTGECTRCFKKDLDVVNL